jgi:hypothetical protein
LQQIGLARKPIAYSILVGIICRGQPWLICTEGGQSHQYLQDDFSHELALYTDGLLFTGCET